MGRTGKIWGYEHFDVEPDVITSAKVRGVSGSPGCRLINGKCCANVFIVLIRVQHEMDRRQQYEVSTWCRWFLGMFPRICNFIAGTVLVAPVEGGGHGYQTARAPPRLGQGSSCCARHLKRTYPLPS